MIPLNREKVTIQQGVAGIVRFWEGNFMPGAKLGQITPVIRNLYIYEKTSSDDVEEVDRGGFYSNISTNLVAELKSDNSGFYQQELPPGKYSIFVKENDLFYGNLIGVDSIMPLEIDENSVATMNIDITYKSVS